MSDPIPQSICIVRLSALGDVLMTVPLIRTLQAALPNTKLTWIISRPAYDLVEGMQNVEFIVIEKPKKLRDYWHFKQQLKGRCFDVLLAVQANFRVNLLYTCISAKRRIGYDKLRAKDGHRWFIKETIVAGHDHTLRGFLRFAEALNITNHHIHWDLHLKPEDLEWAHEHCPDKNKGPVLLVNPAASKTERSWLAERYIAVIKHAQTKWQAQVILTGGPGAHDAELGAAITKEVSVTNLIGKTRPKQLLAVMSLADLILCPDTGPSHMGVAIGTPVLALHAVTSAEVSGPYLYKEWSVDYYPEAVSKYLKKTLATNIWGTHAHGPKTMALIPVKKVIEKLDRLLTDIVA